MGAEPPTRVMELVTRRAVVATAMTLGLAQREWHHAAARAAQPPAVSRALSVAEFTNAVIASRDTNVSPAEVYQTIRERCAVRDADARSGRTRALDLGAGAGASTQMLWDLGWREIVAVDPSRLAWDRFAVKPPPPTVTFVHASDDQYVGRWRRERAEPFDVVVLNYAVNREKAATIARELLAPAGRLLAPANVNADYWFEQEYVELDGSGAVVWRRPSVGPWSVLFQPDFTSDTCQGQWCPRMRADADAANLRL